MALPVRSKLLLVCVAGLCIGLSAAEGERKVLEKTPNPCKQKYDDDFLAKAAEDHLKDFECGRETPTMLLLLGGSGGGKGTFLRHIAKSGFDRARFVPHGLDEYLDYLPEYKATVADPDHVYKDAADACYGGGAIPIAQATQKLLIQRRCDLFYEETGKNLDRVLKRVLPPYAAANYTISVVFVDSLPSIAKQRAYDRFQKEGRYAADGYIEGSFKNVFENYLQLRQNKLVHEAVYCDNSCLTITGPKGPGDCMKCWEHTQGGAPASAAIPAASLLQDPLKYLPREAHISAEPPHEAEL